jgi:hypothetical protein
LDGQYGQRCFDGQLGDFVTGKTVSPPGGQERLAIGRAYNDFLKHPIDRRSPLRASRRVLW